MPLCKLKLRAILVDQNESLQVTAQTLISILTDETVIINDTAINMWINLLYGIPENYAVQVSFGWRRPMLGCSDCTSDL